MPALRRTRQGGFTLVELLIVISLISILAAMGLVQYQNSVLSAKEAMLHTDLFRMRDAIDQYYADKGKYPSALDSLVSDGYMRKVPIDPITQVVRHVGDRAGRTRSEQSERRSRHLRRQEWRAGHRSRRHQLLGLVELLPLPRTAHSSLDGSLMRDRIAARRVADAGLPKTK